MYLYLLKKLGCWKSTSQVDLPINASLVTLRPAKKVTTEYIDICKLNLKFLLAESWLMTNYHVNFQKPINIEG